APPRRRRAPRRRWRAGPGLKKETPSGSAGPLAERVAELAPQRFDVLLVQVDVVLIRLQPLEHPGIVLLVAAADRFLVGELLPGLGEQLLLGGQLLFQDLALALL